MRWILRAICVLALAVLACGESSRAGGNGGVGAFNGEGGNAGDANAALNVADHEKLLECSNSAACEQAVADDPLCTFGYYPPYSPDFCIDALAQVIEGGDPFTMNRIACLLGRLRDRTPGVYRMKLDHGHTIGHEGARHAFAITPSGLIERGVVHYHEYDGVPSTERFWPTERCVPRSADFYDACAAEVDFYERTGGIRDVETNPWDCVFPDWNDPRPPLSDPPWFSNCFSLSPMCE